MKAMKGQNLEANLDPSASRKALLTATKPKLDLNQKNLHSYLLHKTKARILEFNVIKISPEERNLQENEHEQLEPEVTDQTLKKLSQIIRSSTKIHTLKIDCSQCDEVTDRGLQYICESIRGLTSLKSLNLNFKRPHYNRGTLLNAGLYHLHKTLKTLTSLRDLTLSFQSEDENTIGDPGVVMLGFALQKLPSLRIINLEFIDFHEITNTGISSLSTNLNKLTLLKNLYLRFEGTGHHNRQMKIDSTGLQILSQNLKNLTSLQNLSLNFNECKEIGDAGIQALAQTLATFSSSLQKIDFNFEVCRGITQGGVDTLYLSLAKLTSLQNLRLNFGGCFEPTNAGIESFGLRLKPISTSLKSLHQDFSGHSKVTEIGIQNLGETLKSFSLLESLSFNIKFYSATPGAGTKQFFQALAQLSLLKHISLQFSNCKSIHDEGFSILCHSLTKLTLLQSINLDFKFCGEIGDEGMKSLSEALESLSSLRNLHLNFSYCYKITEVGMSDLSQALSQLTLLLHLHLDFTGCSPIRKGIYALGQALKNLVSLRSFYLRCEEVEDDEFSSFAEGIKGLVKLQNIDIIVRSYEVSRECFENFIQALKTLQDLRYIYVRLEMWCEDDEDPDQHIRKSFYPALKTFPYLKNLNIDFRGD